MSKGEKKLVLNGNRNRYFSEAFRKAKAEAIFHGKLSIKDAVALYGVSRTTIYKWLHLYTTVEKNTKTVLQMDSEEQRTKELLIKVAELERVIGQKQLEIDYLDKLIELSGNDLGIDLKKKAEQILLNGLERERM